MDIERALLTKAIQSGQLQRLISKGINSSHFYNEETREIWNSCLKHLRKYKSSPSFDAVKNYHPDFQFQVSSDSLEYLFERFAIQTKRRAAINGLRELAKGVDDL